MSEHYGERVLTQDRPDEVIRLRALADTYDPVSRSLISREGYRIVQEGLTNAARHAGRVPVTLRMAVTGGVLAIDITNPVTNRATGRRRGGRGLDGMRERVELLGGRLRVEAAGGAWCVAVTLPLGGPVRAGGPA